MSSPKNGGDQSKWHWPEVIEQKFNQVDRDLGIVSAAQRSLRSEFVDIVGHIPAKIDRLEAVLLKLVDDLEALHGMVRALLAAEEAPKPKKRKTKL